MLETVEHSPCSGQRRWAKAVFWAAFASLSSIAANFAISAASVATFSAKSSTFGLLDAFLAFLEAFLFFPMLWVASFESCLSLSVKALSVSGLGSSSPW